MALALVCGLMLAGCAGQVDLSKSVTNRTTVRTAGSFTPEMLRTIDPCKLLTDEFIASVGTKGNGSEDRSNYNECQTRIKDKAGKADITLNVKLGNSLLGVPKQGGKQIGGLPVFESPTDTGCTENAVTSRDPDRGLVALVFWEGGKPCDVSSKLIESMIKQLAQNPPKYDVPAGSLVSRDPCADLDDAAAQAALGTTPKKSPYGIRVCTYEGKDNQVNVRYTGFTFDPFDTQGASKPAKVDLTDKVKGAAQFKDNISPNRCQIEWVHRKLAGNRTENVNVSYERSPAQAGEDPCAKLLPAAQAVATKVNSS